jgi:hypothetical protein
MALQYGRCALAWLADGIKEGGAMVGSVAGAMVGSTAVTVEGAALVGLSSTCHSRVAGLRWPVKTVVPSKRIAAVSAVSIAVHPASHSWPMEMREFGLRWGTMCAARAAGGSIEAMMGRLVVWLEESCDPSGSEITIGGVASCCATT